MARPGAPGSFLRERRLLPPAVHHRRVGAPRLVPRGVPRPRSRGRAGREREPPGDLDSPRRFAGRHAEEPAERLGLSVLVGSHLDSVLDGGAYDGPLGVVSSLAAIDLLRERGVTPNRPVVVGAFAEEEGSRFGLACLGSRLATGTTSPDQAKELRDRDGVPLLDAMASAGLWPELGRASWLDRIGCFLELHVEQGRDLVDRDAPVGLATGDLAARALPLRLHRRGQPCGDDADGGPARPDAQLRDDGAGRGQAGEAHRPARHLRPHRRRAQRHQRDPVARDRVARRPLRQRRVAHRARRRDRSASAPSARASTAPGSR